jgi:hypothetical protein
MTTTVKIHVNGRYRATVHQDGQLPVIVEGAYDGSPNPSGLGTFWLGHPARSHFLVVEEWITDEEIAGRAVKEPVRPGVDKGPLT